ncbi:thiosulfate oxidation carrier complex protein SoxZ [Nitrosophilus alvini]|uniref:thiosulfate oxidation carrier complex protein SoxZ n=1 Tax=Nitrosophilus alvini TaxID=2714855 RepID=UPI0019098EF4|nr:thiosulfate oxidation carrier complex protein SoxZ [Nitrosophilus alvini]
MRVRAALKILDKRYKIGDIVKVKAIIIHPMDTGFYKDKYSGKVKPRFYIKKARLFYEEKEVASFDFGVAASENPVVIFPLRVTKKGKLKIVWENNRGESFMKETDIHPL